MLTSVLTRWASGCVLICCVLLGTGCHVLDQRHREEWRGILADEVIEKPEDHMGTWTFALLIQAAGTVMAGAAHTR